MALLGMHLKIEDSEGDEQLSRLLPRSGVIVREVTLDDWNGGWYLLQLDEPFDYQHKIGERYVFKEIHIAHLLIKSRWEGLNIGDAPTSVFVLLVPDVSMFDSGKAFSKDFIFAAWGMAV